MTAACRQGSRDSNHRQGSRGRVSVTAARRYGSRGNHTQAEFAWFCPQAEFAW